MRCFNPRTREGCDRLVTDDEDDIWVSIHAPVKGAILTAKATGFSPPVSIHAPVKGAIVTPNSDKS